MAYGWWGGRLPLVNLVCSHLIFLAVRWRVATRFCLNRFRTRLFRRPVRLTNDGEAVKTLTGWLDRGYDRLNLGGGRKNLSGFVNLDFIRHPSAEREVVANIMDLSFVPSESVSQIHTNHVVEHFTEPELRLQLIEWRRILKNDGIVSLRCPNILGACLGFWFDPILERDRDSFLALGFPEDEAFAESDGGWVHKDIFGLAHFFYGDVGNIENEHRIIITPTRITRLLEAAGFKILRISEPEAINIVLVARKA